MNVGDTIDDFLGLDQEGQQVRLSQYEGRRLVLYFYPKDNTAGCTAQACSLRDGFAALERAGYDIVGVSKDSERSHRNFIAKHTLPFRLIVDKDAVLSTEYGVWKEKSMYGRKYMGVERTTFVIDATTRRIVHIFRGRDISTAEHAEQILALPR